MNLTTQMKATGEVMSICTNFEGALMKALRSLEQHVDSLWSSRYKDMTDEEVIELLGHVDDRRIYVIAEATQTWNHHTIRSMTSPRSTDGS